MTPTFSEAFKALYTSVATAILLEDHEHSQRMVFEFATRHDLGVLDLHEIVIDVFEQADESADGEGWDVGMAFLGGLYRMVREVPECRDGIFEGPDQALDLLDELDREAHAQRLVVEDDEDMRLPGNWKVALAEVWNDLVLEGSVRGPGWYVNWARHAYWCRFGDHLLKRDRVGWGGKLVDLFVAQWGEGIEREAVFGKSEREVENKFMNVCWGQITSEKAHDVGIWHYRVPTSLAKHLFRYGDEYEFFNDLDDVDLELCPYVPDAQLVKTFQYVRRVGP